MKNIVCSLICLTSSTLCIAQTSILNANSPQTFREDRETRKDSITPLKYGFIEDKDIFKSKITWEIIDMNDKINQPFYHNDDQLVTQSKSLYQILLDAVNSGKISEVYSDDTFTTKLTPEQIAAATSTVVVADYFTETLNANKLEEADANKYLPYFTSLKGTGNESVNSLFAKYQDRLTDVMGYDPSATPPPPQPTTTEEVVTTGKGKKKKTKTVKKVVQAPQPPQIDPGTVLIKLDGSWYKIAMNDITANVDKITTTTEKVKAIKLMGMWYIDKRNTQLRYRLLGLAAMGEDPNSAALKASQMQAMAENGVPMDTAAGQTTDLIDLFWIYYPDARSILSANTIFNSKNSTSDITFDDVLNARRFSSVIYKTDNGMGKGGSGVIDEYIPNDAEGQLEESDRIKAQIMQMENDLWNY